MIWKQLRLTVQLAAASTCMNYLFEGPWPLTMINIEMNVTLTQLVSFPFQEYLLLQSLRVPPRPLVGEILK